MQNTEKTEKPLTHTELISRIQDIICDIWNANFTGNIIVRDLDPVGYEIGFEDHQYQPTWFSASLPDDEFLKEIRDFIRKSSMFQALRFMTVRNTTVFKQNTFIH